MSTASETPANPAPKKEEEAIIFPTFLESVSPGVRKNITGLHKKVPGGHQVLDTPDLLLHCDSSICGGLRTFKCDDTPYFGSSHGVQNFFLHYVCRNCHSRGKNFALQIHNGTAVKYGEIPAFGPPTPARAMKLIGGDRELFLKGRRCELQGLGIAAFTYYRRVIEGQRNRIFDEIIKVLEKVDPSNEVIVELKAAKAETQFTKSIEAIKHAMPASLLINGRNPLRLLHSALSEGVHAMSDEDCLAMATAARTVLFEFSERLAQALSDDAELAKAITLLNKPKPHTTQV